MKCLRDVVNVLKWGKADAFLENPEWAPGLGLFLLLASFVALLLGARS